MYFDTNQLPTLPFWGPHSKPHVSTGFSKHYHSRFDPKIGHCICAICYIPCACIVCTSNIDQPYISSISLKKQARYQPVMDYTYWPVIGSFKNWNIIHMSPKSTPF